MLCKYLSEISTNIGLQLFRKLDLKKAPLVRSCETGASLQEAFTLTILQFTCKAWTKVVKDICWNDFFQIKKRTIQIHFPRPSDIMETSQPSLTPCSSSRYGRCGRCCHTCCPSPSMMTIMTTMMFMIMIITIMKMIFIIMKVGVAVTL